MAEIPKPKIPEVVDLKDADPERRELYGEASKVFMEERKKAQMFVPGQAEPDAEAAERTEETAVVEKPKEPEITDEDKRAFVRSILSERVFEKAYPLFGGQVEATFVDRTTAETDRLFERLDKAGSLDEEKWSAEADILCLCSTLREIKRPDGRSSFPPTDDYESRASEIKKLPRPLYEVLIETSRDFEGLINHLIGKARDPGFWPAGGSASLSRRTAGAR